jgi:hypothetical protein
MQHAVEVVTRLSADLQLDHVYCLYLLRAVSHEVRVCLCVYMARYLCTRRVFSTEDSGCCC